jgi:hypothetical protein
MQQPSRGSVALTPVALALRSRHLAVQPLSPVLLAATAATPPPTRAPTQQLPCACLLMVHALGGDVIARREAVLVHLVQLPNRERWDQGWCGALTPKEAERDQGWCNHDGKRRGARGGVVRSDGKEEERDQGWCVALDHNGKEEWGPGVVRWLVPWQSRRRAPTRSSRCGSGSASCRPRHRPSPHPSRRPSPPPSRRRGAPRRRRR